MLQHGFSENNLSIDRNQCGASTGRNPRIMTGTVHMWAHGHVHLHTVRIRARIRFRIRARVRIRVGIRVRIRVKIGIRLFGVFIMATASNVVVSPYFAAGSSRAELRPAQHTHARTHTHTRKHTEFGKNKQAEANKSKYEIRLINRRDDHGGCRYSGICFVFSFQMQDCHKTEGNYWIKILTDVSTKYTSRSAGKKVQCSVTIKRFFVLLSFEVNWN